MCINLHRQRGRQHKIRESSVAVRGSLNAFKNRVSGNGSVRHEDNLLKQMYALIKTTDKQGRIGAV